MKKFYRPQSHNRVFIKLFSALIFLSLLVAVDFRIFASENIHDSSSPSFRVAQQNGFTASVSGITPELEQTYRNLPDAEIIRRFSATFLPFNPAKCHFTSNQGMNPGNRFHDGYDFNCMPKNTPFEMTIPLPLLITEVAYDDLYGNHIIARDLSGRFTFVFAHLSAWYVGAGEVSSMQRPMFKTGTSGNSTGVHLHVEILKNGFPVQLDDSVYEQFLTLYKKQEKDPAEVLKKVLQLSDAQLEEEYVAYVSNRFYPLSWYKLIALSKYENISLLGLINRMSEGSVQDYYQFYTYFVNLKGLKDAKKRDKELSAVRVFLHAFTREQFVSDNRLEAAVAEAERSFQKMNPADYPVKKPVPKKKVVAKPAKK